MSVVVPVFRDAARAIALARSLVEQDLPVGLPLEIILVDDGSDDGTGDALREALGGAARIESLPANAGRSAARNAGARLATGDLLLFLDCDCLPAHPGLLKAHLACLTDDAVASIGPVVGQGSGFWHRYQSDASARRRRQHQSGMGYSGSSQNLLVRRTAFEAVGGFDLCFRSYGFEDRDLQIRLLRIGAIAWATDATVRHMDSLSMVEVAQKMKQAAGASAEEFRGRHPEAYVKLGYAALDARVHPWLRAPAYCAGLCAPAAARAVDRALAAAWMPYPVQRLLVKGVSAASYLSGSVRR